MNVQLTNEETQEFELFYKNVEERQRRDIAGSGLELISPSSRVAFCEQVIRSVKDGNYPYLGEWQYVHPQGDPTDPGAIAAGTKKPTYAKWQIIVGSAALLLVAYVVASLLTGSTLLPSQTPAASRAVVTAASTSTSPTPSEVVPTPQVGFITVNGQPVPEVHPLTLELGGRRMLVYAAPVAGDNWMVRQDPSVANWIPGARINWSFGVWPGSDAAATAWLNSLKPGTTAQLRVKWVDGTVVTLNFTLTTRETIDRSQTEVFNPTKPGLSVVVSTGQAQTLLRGLDLSLGKPRPTGGR